MRASPDRLRQPDPRKQGNIHDRRLSLRLNLKVTTKRKKRNPVKQPPGARKRASPGRRRPAGPVPERVISSRVLRCGRTGPKELGGRQPLPRNPARSAPTGSARDFQSQSQRLTKAEPPPPREEMG